ncbi:uncharacterized protein BJX67DRAFT_344609 [Aspergillus lucknowensis]|uniref:Mediator of RNA polymerase II transcription subunit 13 n=1 Tax=Aspergillus lucknowensis TaxID=176173 RepID=A0ABR4M1X1_9EURO
MEFPGGFITNVRVIDGFSNIHWRIYTEDTGGTIPSGDGSNQGYTILKHISRLKELELQLRSLGCLVLSYPRRLGLLIFSATPDFEHLSPLLPTDKKDESNRLLIGTTILRVWTCGSVSSGDLAKSLHSDIQTTAANSPAASQRLQNGPVPPRRMDNSGGSAAIYASFVSAVTAAFSLQIVRQNNAIPLGPRTLFSTVESDFDQIAVNSGQIPISTLTSLHVQLMSVGKLTISLQTIAQIGFTRLSQPGRPSSEYSQIPPGTDLWLAPNGSIARLAEVHPGMNNSPHTHSAREASEWKFNVREWLSYFGLPVDFITDEDWVEVEVWEPLYAKLSGEAGRPLDESCPLPLKRILWPAMYCFRRVKSTLPLAFEGTEEKAPFDCDPLEFAEKWCFQEIPEAVERNVKPLPEDERPSNIESTLSPAPTNPPEGFESLARASLHPELQTANLVYPTPPDGAGGIGVNPGVFADAFAENPDHGSLSIRGRVQQPHGSRFIAKDRSDPDVTMGFGPSAGLAVGSGLYDTNDDDDLFGDMNGKDFGTKGITDADFSFFDEPDFDSSGNGANLDDAEAISNLVDKRKPDTEFVEPEAQAPSTVTNDASHSRHPSTERIANTPPNQPPPRTNTLETSPHHDKIQTISPPLSPVEVKRILFPEPTTGVQTLAKPTHVPRYYSPIAFKNPISSWDKKYGADGSFSFMGVDTALNKGSYTSSGGIPTIGFPRRKSSVKVATYAKPLEGQGSPQNQTAPGLLSSPDSSSETGDESDDSSSETGIPSTTFATLKRKRGRSNSACSAGPYSGKTTTGPDQELPTLPRSDNSVFLGNFLSTFSDWSISGFFSLTENQIFPTLTPREVQVQIAQLLVDQVTQSSLNHKLDGNIGVSHLENQAFCLQDLPEGTEFLSGLEKLDLNNLISLQEQNVSSPAALNTPTPRQNPQRKETCKGSITKLPPPHLRVRRGKDYLEALPPAVSFWETFGLEPVHGPKDITGYCIHPQVAAKAADVFLERLSLLYSSCNLGTHIRGCDSNAFDRGLGGWNTDSLKQSSYLTSIHKLKEICEELGTALSNGPLSADNIVVYIINPFSHAASLVDICAAFWALLQKYTADADKQQPAQLSQVVLQIIPVDFVTSAESLIVPPQTDYVNLAMEVYSRCSPKQIQGGVLNCTPPAILAEPIPSSIGFKLASERTSPLQEGKCLHVACSRSQDQRWISVAWSDNSGVFQHTMSYCLRFRNSTISRNLSTVRSEIWAATRGILEKSQVRWRIILVNTENVDQDEHDTWLNLAEQYNSTSNVPVELTILSANTTPDLFLSPPPSPMPMSILNPQASSTPVATPLPSGATLSPDHSGNVPTPPSGANIPANATTPTDALIESESESLLTDICDESWGIVLSHRLNGTLHLTEYRPALASGYLIRRRGVMDSDGAFTMNVNLLYTQRPPSSYDSLLREIIGMYRDLATLARVRGIRIVQSSTLPWHIATVVRAQETLSYVL